MLSHLSYRNFWHDGNVYAYYVFTHYHVVIFSENTLLVKNRFGDDLPAGKGKKNGT